MAYFFGPQVKQKSEDHTRDCSRLKAG